VGCEAGGRKRPRPQSKGLESAGNVRGNIPWFDVIEKKGRIMGDESVERKRRKLKVGPCWTKEASKEFEPDTSDWGFLGMNDYAFWLVSDPIRTTILILSLLEKL
jgi:hypothetical protein